MAGTCLVIDDAVDEILVGSDPDCRLSLDLPGVSPIHARVWRDLGGMTVYDTHSPRGLYVNDERVVEHAAVHDGDVLWLGAPGDPDSVMIQCRLPEESLLGAPVVDVAPSASADAEPAAPPPPDAEITAPDPAPPAPETEASPPFEVPPFEVPPSEVPPPFDVPPSDVPPSEVPAFEVPAFEVPTFEDPPVLATAAPPPPPVEAPAAADASAATPDEDFVMDPAWGEYDGLEAPAEPPPPVDLDALLDDVSPPAAAAPPPAAPTPIVTAAAPVVHPAPVLPAPPAPAAPVRQFGGAPPLTPAPMAPTTAPAVRTPPAPVAAPRAIVDDTRPPRPAPRKPASPPRVGSAEAVMARPPARTGRGPLLAVAAAVVVLAALGGGYYAWSVSRTPRITAVSPARVTAGHTLTLTGAHLGEIVAATSASIGGRPARVVQASGDRLQIEVPELPTTSGQDISVPIVVTAGGRASKPASVAIYQAPNLKSLVPDVAMPGEDVVLTGTSLGAGVKVRFGDTEAQVVSATPVSLTVKVPALPAATGTEVPVVAAIGADSSNALTFVVGRVPLVTGIEPRSAAPGDLVTVAGRGFNARPQANRVTVGGLPALVISAGPRGLEFVVPRVIAGEGAVAVTVPGSTNVGKEEMSISALPEPIGFRFVAEPFEDVPGHEHAAVATGLGPAFVLTGAQGKSAAERAYEAQKRLNDAAQVLRSTRTAEIRARYEPSPAVYLVTRDTALLDVTAADAEGYNEDWTRSRAKGAPVTPARLTTWWEAVARDLVLLLLRGERPQYAQALAPEGKVLGDLSDAAKRSVSVGVPSALLTAARAPMREALRAVALRVPATVSAPVTGAEVGVAGAADGGPPLKLDGTWRGSETESGTRRPITLVFEGGSGTLTYERALSMSVPVFRVQQPQKGTVRFEVRVGTGMRFYRGRWDGARITGTLTSDSEGRTQIGTFELDPSR